MFGAKWYYLERQAFIASDMIGLWRSPPQDGPLPAWSVPLIGPARKGLSWSSAPFRVTVQKKVLFAAFPRHLWNSPIQELYLLASELFPSGKALHPSILLQSVVKPNDYCLRQPLNSWHNQKQAPVCEIIPALVFCWTLSLQALPFLIWTSLLCSQALWYLFFLQIFSIHTSWFIILL